MLWPKKNSYKEFDNEKKFLRLENSPPPHNFSNGPSLSLRRKNKRLLTFRSVWGQRSCQDNLINQLNPSNFKRFINRA